MKNTVIIVPFSLILLTISACTTNSLQRDFRDVAPTSEGVPATNSPNVDLGPSLGDAFAPPVRPSLDLNQTLPDLPPPPPPSARTVEEFDTTSAEDRAAAIVSSPNSGERRLGTTIASLGSPTEPGIWFKTPLVSSIVQGRIEYSGTSIGVELRPTGGTDSTGSQISLAAMRLIGAPLTALPEVTVYGD